MKKLYVQVDESGNLIKEPHLREQITDFDLIQKLSNNKPIFREYIEVKPTTYNKITSYVQKTDTNITDTTYEVTHSVVSRSSEELSTYKQTLKDEARNTFLSRVHSFYEPSELTDISNKFIIQYISHSAAGLQGLPNTKTANLYVAIESGIQSVVDIQNTSSVYYKIENEDDTYTTDFSTWVPPISTSYDDIWEERVFKL